MIGYPFNVNWGARIRLGEILKNFGPFMNAIGLILNGVETDPHIDHIAKTSDGKGWRIPMRFQGGPHDFSFRVYFTDRLIDTEGGDTEPTYRINVAPGWIRQAIGDIEFPGASEIKVTGDYVRLKRTRSDGTLEIITEVTETASDATHSYVTLAELVDNGETSQPKTVAQRVLGDIQIYERQVTDFLASSNPDCLVIRVRSYEVEGATAEEDLFLTETREVKECTPSSGSG